MNSLHSSTDPASLQSILEESTISSDHTPAGLCAQVAGVSSRCRARSSASDSREPTGGAWISTSAIAYPTGSAGRPWLPAARPDLTQADPFPGQRPGSCGAERRDDANGPTRDPRYHLTEVLSKRHPKGASVASLRLFMIDRNRVDVRRNTQMSTVACNDLRELQWWAWSTR